MAEALFELQMISPEGIFYTGEVFMLELNTGGGRIGIYRNHIPMTCVIEPGAVVIHENGGIRRAAVRQGFIQILPEKTTLLAEDIRWDDKMDSEGMGTD